MSRFTSGDKVVAHLTVGKPADAPATFPDINSGLGHGAHGTMSRYAVFHETSLVAMPVTLGFREAATLTCSGLTAWNALFGAALPGRGRGLCQGDIVLVQGSGGVSVAALQVCFLLVTYLLTYLPTYLLYTWEMRADLI